MEALRLPRKREEQLKGVREMYDAWFKIWKDVYVPHLLFQPKWFLTDRDLLPGDLVHFMNSGRPSLTSGPSGWWNMCRRAEMGS